MSEKRIIRRWGYHASKPAKIFELEEGASLPSGWFDSPARVEAAKPKNKPKAKVEKAKPDPEEVTSGEWPGGEEFISGLEDEDDEDSQ